MMNVAAITKILLACGRYGATGVKTNEHNAAVSMLDIGMAKSVSKYAFGGTLVTLTEYGMSLAAELHKVTNA